ncbi:MULTISPECIES: chromate transporter [Pseudanabaena]|uniref:Chromate transporter, chromate ion transporter (CHR) family n=2 Tax=Pseudanabaena TaxID=1152 RepID=L8MZQ7_9CYAN|nr:MULTISPECIES: chromate transporter [Pseudanabaena]ELS31478.1 chromate transporter, chromate ion transporter (CHR) family [Pseudanabaena biceps PCC 7429]MDG3496266.1 chromate transporter [Pseudanabaena catenata USMAC16]
MPEYTKTDLEAENLPNDREPLLPKKTSLGEIALVFSKLGITAFGGPAAHIAQIELEVVQRRQWLSREKLLDLLSISNLIPGPNSTELVIHVGLERAGWQGMLVAGSCFILPAMLMTWGLAIAYGQYQSIPTAGGLLYGIKPVIIAIVLQALTKLGRSGLKSAATWSAGILVLVLYLLSINEIILMLSAGLIVALVANLHSLKKFRFLSLTISPLSWGTFTLGAIATESHPKTWLAVFWSFLKIGSFLYGGGYVLLAFVQQEFVDRLHWLTSQQLLDAVAIGQFTPGPILTTATFIGYLIAGNLGAIAATIGIFLPAFMLVPLINPFVSKLRKSPWTAGFLDGVNAASIGLMAAVAWELGRGTLTDIWTIVIAIASLAILLKFPKLNSVWLVLAGGAIGWLLKFYQ